MSLRRNLHIQYYNMMKKITRFHAKEMFSTLGRLSLTHLSDDTLGKVMDNFLSLKKVADEYELLKQELGKRLYGDPALMDEKERSELDAFFMKVSQMEHAAEGEDAKLEQSIKAEYPRLYDLRCKEVKALLAMLGKEVDVELAEVDDEDFIKGVLLGNKGERAISVRDCFAPMFAEKETPDLSEIDELLEV